MPEGEESVEVMLGDGSANRQSVSSPAGNKKPQYLITLAATLVVVSGGSAIGWTSPALPDLTAPDSLLPLIGEQGSWVGSLLAIGAFIGALPAGAAADAIGRKKLIWMLGIPMMLSWILTICLGSVWILYLARLLAGFSLGAACTAVPMYIAEIAEDSVRGTLCSYFQLMLVAGILYTYIVGAVTSYRVYCIFCSVIPILFMVFFYKCPETPIYLLNKGRKQEAKDALRKLRGEDYNINNEINYLQGSLDKSSKENSSFTQAICKKESVKALIICLGLMVFQQLSGINIVIFYSSAIFKDVGAGIDPSLATIFVGVAQVVATYVSGLLIDRAGRRILLMISAVVMAVCLGALGQFFQMKTNGTDVSHLGFIPLIAVIMYILVFAIGFGPVPWLMTGEVLPSEIKGVGTGIAVALNWSLAFTVTKTFQDMLDAFGPAKTYWVFAVVCCIAAGFVAGVVIETKGKSLSEIQDELGGKKRPQPRARNSIIRNPA